jgi:protein-disulfide isomerase
MLFNDQGKLSSDLYVEIATGLGISKESFTECLESSDVADAVSKDANDALGVGARGTPFSVVVSEKNGTLVPVSGALPLEQVKQFVDQAL